MYNNEIITKCYSHCFVGYYENEMDWVEVVNSNSSDLTDDEIASWAKKIGKNHGSAFEDSVEYWGLIRMHNHLRD